MMPAFSHGDYALIIDGTHVFPRSVFPQIALLTVTPDSAIMKIGELYGTVQLLG
jgi:hypothetical protein